MDKELLRGQIVKNMSVTIKMIKEMDKERTPMPMEINT